jgi:hypothetical protein
MHRFGPFLTPDSNHMIMLVRRLVALMLQLRGPFTHNSQGFPLPKGTSFVSQETPKPRSRSWPRREAGQLDEGEKYRQDNPRRDQFRADPGSHSKPKPNPNVPKPKGA